MFRLIGLLTVILGALAGLAMALMMFHVMADVMGKYLFHYPVPSTAEVVANYYMIAGVFLALAWVEATGSAIAVDLFYERASPPVQRVMYKFGQLVTLVFYAALGWFSWMLQCAPGRFPKRLMAFGALLYGLRSSCFRLVSRWPSWSSC